MQNKTATSNALICQHDIELEIKNCRGEFQTRPFHLPVLFIDAYSTAVRRTRGETEQSSS